MHNRFSNWVNWMLAVAFIVCAVQAIGQTITGDISGTVTDTTGAVVVGARSTATNVDTGVSFSATTNREGIYSIRFLPVGTYKVTISAASFGTQTFGPLLIEVSHVARVDASLKAGSETQNVTVESGSASLLNTEDGTVTTTISETLINDLPVNGHNFTELTQLMPGSTVADGNQWNGAGQSSPNNSGERVQSFATLPNINGNRTYTTNFTIDGISIVDTGANLNNGFGAPAYNMPPEATKELSIVSNVPPAEYGDGATQIAVITKNGTDTFHGSAGFYLQNYLMDANLYQNKRVLPGNTFAPRTQYTQRQFNVTLGGPVRIPHVFDGRDKLFFFTDYEAYRKPSAGSGRVNLPLNAWRGNTSGSGNSADTSLSPLAGYAYFGSAVPQLYDSQNGYAPFNQTVNGVFYQNLVPIRNPVAKYLFAHPEFLPAPNTTPSLAPVVGNYQGYSKGISRNDQGDVKIDWAVSQKDHLSGRWSDGDANDGTIQPILAITFPGLNDFPFKQFALNYVHTFSTTVVDEFRAGYTRVHYNSYPLASSVFANGNTLVGIPWSNTVAGFSAQNFTGSTNSTSVTGFGTSGGFNLALDNQFSYGDNLTWQHGRHVSKFGAQWFRTQNNFFQNNSGGLLGSFNYSGVFTGKPAAGQTVGYDFADFLLDYSSGYSVSLQTGDVGERQGRFSVFAQDSFKILPKVTINYGLRWEYDQPLYEVNNKLSKIDPTTGALIIAGQNGNSRSLYQPTYGEFDPRLGFAWSLNSKLVVRGGFGVTSYMDYNLLHNHVGNAPFHTSLNATAAAPTKTSTGTPYAVTNGFGATGATPGGVSFTSWGSLKPMWEPQYSLITEYAITGKSAVSLAYVGNIAQHLGDVRNINQWATPGVPTSAPFYNVSVATPTGGVGILSNAVQLYESEAYSNFNAGELTYRLLPTRGLEFQMAYTYSKAMGDTSGPVAVNDNNISGGNPQNNFCLSCEYGPSASDSRHMLSSSWDYAMPFGRGKQLVGNAPLWLDEVIGGWRLSGSAVLFSGQPNTITATGSANVGSAGPLRANHYRRLKTTGVKDGLYQTSCGFDTGSGSSNCSMIVAGAWGTDASATHSGNVGTGTCGQAGFDDGTCAYGQPSASSAATGAIYGNASVGSERAQGFRQVDASLQKSWKLHETHELLFISEFYNVGNIVSYNNQGRTVNGGSAWGFVQSTRSEPRQIELEMKYKF